jgi:hypothetical protein
VQHFRGSARAHVLGKDHGREVKGSNRAFIPGPPSKTGLGFTPG